MASTLLAEFGAQVLKLEMPGAGDGLRNFPPFKDGKSLWWKAVNRNKKFATLDLHKPEGIALLKRMLPQVDVLIENFRPGTLDKWGLDKATLWSLQPRLVILRVTGFGQTGPNRNQPGFARIFEAMGGLTYITGEADGEPMHAGYPLGDAIGGLFGAMSVMTALWPIARNPERKGEEIDLSLTEAMLRICDYMPSEYEQLGLVRERGGNANQYSAPSLVCRSSDGHWFTLAGSTNALWERNCRSIGQPELIQDPRFRDNASRVIHAKALNGIFRDWCATQTADQVSEAFRVHGGTISRIYSSADIARDPHFAARGALVDVPDADFGTIRQVAPVPRFSSGTAPLANSAQALSHDNDEVYGDWLGLDAAERVRLKELGVI